MITVKISELLNSTEVLQKLSRTDLKAKPSWKVARLLKSADVEIQEFNDTRLKLIQKYGQKDENGELVTDADGNCQIIQESIAQFSSELNELLNTDVEINADRIRIEDIEHLDFTPAEMSILEPFIDFGE